MAPILLPPNQPAARFYKGGPKISALRGEEPASDPYQPEDWVASTTCCNGCESSKLGMSTLPDGRLLADAIAKDPETWLGAEHMARFGVDTKLLFKLLDAGQRLPVHAHPHVDWARKHVGREHGKAEAWYILSPGDIHIGLKEDVPREELLEIVNTQNIDAILSKMHKLSVQRHQVVYVPPGILHAIGEGILIVELQEPEDLSILVEWTGFQIDGAKDGHLGLGFPTALTAVDNKAKTAEQISSLVTNAESGSVVARESREYFDLERVQVSTGSGGEGQKCRPGFAIFVVLEGSVAMTTDKGDKLNLSQGKTLVIPNAEGGFRLQGSGDVLIARPPQ